MINRRLALLLLSAAALAGYVHWTDGGSLLHRWMGDTVETAAVATDASSSAPAKPAERRTAANPLKGLGVDDLAEIAARPLFNPTRAPAPQPEQAAPEPVVEVEQPPPEPTVNIEDYTLLAVAAGDAGNMAIVRQNSTSEFFHLKQGDSIAELQVAEIGVRAIKLTMQDQTYELKLFDKRSDVAAPPPAIQDSEPQPVEGGPESDAQFDPNQQARPRGERQGMAPGQVDPTSIQRMNASEQ